MGRRYDTLDETLQRWIGEQPMFFVATAPNDPAGHVNLSPKGTMQTFRILGPTAVAYLDLTGSGIETVAHLRENGRITIMFCAFQGAPKVVRLHGTGRVVQPQDAGFDELIASFDPTADLLALLRSVIVIDLDRISDSCGFTVPRMELIEERQTLFQFGEQKAKRLGADWRTAYHQANNRESIDGLPGLDLPEDAVPLTDAELRQLSSAGKAL